MPTGSTAGRAAGPEMASIRAMTAAQRHAFGAGMLDAAQRRVQPLDGTPLSLTPRLCSALLRLAEGAPHRGAQREVDGVRQPALRTARLAKRATSSASSSEAGSGSGSPVIHEASVSAPSAAWVMPREPSAVNTNRPAWRGTRRG